MGARGGDEVVERSEDARKKLPLGKQPGERRSKPISIILAPEKIIPCQCSPIQINAAISFPFHILHLIPIYFALGIPSQGFYTTRIVFPCCYAFHKVKMGRFLLSILILLKEKANGKFFVSSPPPCLISPSHKWREMPLTQTGMWPVSFPPKGEQISTDEIGLKSGTLGTQEITFYLYFTPNHTSILNFVLNDWINKLRLRYHSDRKLDKF